MLNKKQNRKFEIICRPIHWEIFTFLESGTVSLSLSFFLSLSLSLSIYIYIYICVCVCVCACVCEWVCVCVCVCVILGNFCNRTSMLNIVKVLYKLVYQMSTTNENVLIDCLIAMRQSVILNNTASQDGRDSNVQQNEPLKEGNVEKMLGARRKILEITKVRSNNYIHNHSTVGHIL